MKEESKKEENNNETKKNLIIAIISVIGVILGAIIAGNATIIAAIVPPLLERIPSAPPMNTATTVISINKNPILEATSPPDVSTLETSCVPDNRDDNLIFEKTVPTGAIMRLVLGGEFAMGSYLEDGKGPHFVCLDSFYVDKYEVSNAQYKLCVDVGACSPPKESRSSTHSDYYGNPEFDHFPVIFVDWEMARTYCEWRGGRLPTEAEWEKAARGTDGRTYPWGDEISCAYANYGESADVACVGDTTAVGSYKEGKSVYGLYDMAGNVNEWVSSLYEDYPYDVNDGRESLDAPGMRVFRGGSWNYLTGDIRVSNRNGIDLTIANGANDSIGFRCAQSP